jgi:hypothetical protein
MTIDFAKVFAGPDPIVPEVPYPALLLVGGLVSIGGFMFLRRRSTFSAV